MSNLMKTQVNKAMKPTDLNKSQAGDLEMITTGAVGLPLGEDPSGLRVVKIYADRLDHQYYPLDQVPLRVALMGTSN